MARHVVVRTVIGRGVHVETCRQNLLQSRMRFDTPQEKKEMAPTRFHLASRGGFPGPVGVSPGANLLVKLDLVGVSPRLQKFRSQSDRRDQQTDDSTNRVGRQDVRQRRRTTRHERSSWALPHTHDAETRSTREQDEPTGCARPRQEDKGAAAHTQDRHRDRAEQPTCADSGQGRANVLRDRQRKVKAEERRAPPGARSHSCACRCTK